MYIGIDLGTSNSAIAGVTDGKARLFHPADGGEVLPSIIFIDKRGHRLYGRRAHDQSLIVPENVAAGFKRLMGTATQIEIKGANVTLSPEECSAEIIRQLLGQVSTETGRDDFTGAVITVPASFNQMQSEATLRAAKLAGLERVDLLQEPVAAALAAMANRENSGRFLIYDLGGGTFDVALAEATSGEVRIVAHQGVNMLGGRDFDRAIVNELVRPWLAQNFDLPEGFARDPNYARLMRVALLAAEKAKIDLTVQEKTSLFASDDEIRLMDQSEEPLFLDIPLTRSTFESWIERPVRQTIQSVRNLLEENEIAPASIDRIVFIGGPSRTPLIRRLVPQELGIPADLETDAMTAVATGAAYYAEGRQWSPANISSPKPAQVTMAPVPAAPEILFDYTQRTPEDKTLVTVRLPKPPETPRQLRLISENWDSGLQPLQDGLTLLVPLTQVGAHLFKVQILDEAGILLSEADSLSVTRVVATTGGIPAAQTISVKVLASHGARKNLLHPLINKGTILPAEGTASFVAACPLSASSTGSLSFELFQVEYPERIELNLCIGAFRIASDDLPEGYAVETGDQIAFRWQMSDSGILQATVLLPQAEKAPLELKVPRFYAPQAGQVAFDAEKGRAFAEAIFKHAEEEWGDLAAALGPDGGEEINILKTRLSEQQEVLAEAGEEAETIRHMVEEARFIRQDIARLGKKHMGAMLQRRLGKMTTVFNRIARGTAAAAEQTRFDEIAASIQEIIEAKNEPQFENADLYLGDLRDLFFAVAWRDPAYISAWFKKLNAESFLFPDAAEYLALVAEGNRHLAANDNNSLRELVRRMLGARLALGASDSAAELATIIKG